MKEELRELYKKSTLDGLQIVSDHLKEAREKQYWWKIEKYSEYPSITYFDSGFPSFHLSAYEKNDYNRILHKDNKGENLISWKSYHAYVESSEELQKFYEIGEYASGPAKADNELWTKVFTYYQLSGFIDRYIHLNSDSTNFEESLFNQQFDKWYNSITLKELPVEIHVPILLTTFDFEKEDFDQRISVQKMNEKFQLSRHGKTSFTDSSNSIVAGAATHSLVLKNWTIDNSTYNKRHEILHELKSYEPVIELVEKFFSCIRIKNGISTGFCQLIAHASTWEDRTKGDLDNTFVVSVRKYPDFFDHYGWITEPPKLSRKDTKDIYEIFNKVLNNEHNRINLSLSRLNRAYLRSREEDTILDITIALETLITHDSKSEITFRLASRVAAICTVRQFKDFDAYRVFEFCKKIYSYRSAVVHGDSKRIDKTRIIKHDEGEELPTISLSIELLRHTLDVLLEFPLYNDPKEIDKLNYKQA